MSLTEFLIFCKNTKLNCLDFTIFQCCTYRKDILVVTLGTRELSKETPGMSLVSLPSAFVSITSEGHLHSCEDAGSALRTSCFHTISRFPNSTRVDITVYQHGKMFYISFIISSKKIRNYFNELAAGNFPCLH